MFMQRFLGFVYIFRRFARFNQISKTWSDLCDDFLNAISFKNRPRVHFWTLLKIYFLHNRLLWSNHGSVGTIETKKLACSGFITNFSINGIFPVFEGRRRSNPFPENRTLIRVLCLPEMSSLYRRTRRVGGKRKSIFPNDRHF